MAFDFDFNQYFTHMLKPIIILLEIEKVNQKLTKSAKPKKQQNNPTIHFIHFLNGIVLFDVHRQKGNT